MSELPRVAVAGGGVIGLTTAVLLQLHGYKADIYSETLVTDLLELPPAKWPPQLASIHAAASIIPHSADHEREQAITESSQKFFRALRFSANSGIRTQRHYELFEEQPKIYPEYIRALDELHLLPSDGTAWISDPNIPRRKQAPGVFGWSFDAYFCETPTYLLTLMTLFTRLGGKWHERSFESREDFDKLDADIVVNCLGYGALNIYPEDGVNADLRRGHMVKVEISHAPFAPNGDYFSYNYYPGAENYWQGAQKEAADVYFYPRSDGWLLGGSRQVGSATQNGEWRGEEYSDIGGREYRGPERDWDIKVPGPVWELNRELLLDVTGVDVANYKHSPYAGYRFIRKPIRLELDQPVNRKEKLLIHNYGHGGAGYTLSWGTACEVIRLIEEATGDEPVFRMPTYSEASRIRPLIGILQDLARDLYMDRKRDNFRLEAS